MKIKLNAHALRYGVNGLTESMITGQLGFELEISDEKTVIRNILTVEQLYDLVSQINKAEKDYKEFKSKFRGENNGIEIGSIVMLNSGGPEMKVVDITSDCFTCRWNDGDEMATQSYRKGTVQLVK